MKWHRPAIFLDQITTVLDDPSCCRCKSRASPLCGAPKDRTGGRPFHLIVVIRCFLGIDCTKHILTSPHVGSDTRCGRSATEPQPPDRRSPTHSSRPWRPSVIPRARSQTCAQQSTRPQQRPAHEMGHVSDSSFTGKSRKPK